MKKIWSTTTFCLVLAICFPQLAATQVAVTVPAGTDIDVVLTDPLDSGRAAAGEVSRASVGEAIVFGDVVAIRKGSDAVIELVRSSDGKSWFVKLTSLKVRDTDYPVVASFAELKAGRSGAKAARRAVGLGAVGGLIGAIAGGGKGAAIGAASGAGVGAVSGAIARGDKINLPAETVLSFQLRSDLVLK